MPTKTEPKPKAKTKPAGRPKRQSRGDTNQIADRVTQEVIKRSDS